MADTAGFVVNCNDDEASRYLIGRLLEREGYRVRDASTGAEALALAALGPSLIVLDVHLPDMSGLEVCRRLKAVAATAGIPVLQTSASFTSPDHHVEGLDSGADAYLPQPVEPLVLTATIRALLRARRAEDAVRDAAMTWQSTFDAIADGVATVNATGQVVQANASMLHWLGKARGEVVGQSCETLLRAAFGLESLSLLPVVLQTHSREALDVPMMEERWVRVSADPALAGPGGAIHRMVVTVTDVSDLKRVESVQRQRAEDLMIADRRKDEFLAMLAHELRNPLHAIATANSLQDRFGAQDAHNVRLRATVARQTRHLARLVDDLLEVSRITRGQIQLHKEPIDLRDALHQAAQSTRPHIEAKQQQLTVQVPPDPVSVDGDALRLEQVFVNLIGNASKYSPVNAHIAIACERVSWGVEIRVSDDGVGIPQDQIGSIFDLFTQVNPSLARSAGGLGIGLTIARTLVDLHGGTITARSDGAGHGTEFTITLPVIDSGTGPRVGARASETSAACREALSVLLIEDHPDLCETMRGLLESWGHRVTVATDGTDGLAMALALKPDVALVDVGLPGIDGYEVAENLRASDAGRRMLLVALTGYGRPEDRARALDSGFDLHLVKPVQPERLRDLLADPAIRASPSSTEAPS